MVMAAFSLSVSFSFSFPSASVVFIGWMYCSVVCVSWAGLSQRRIAVNSYNKILTMHVTNIITTSTTSSSFLIYNDLLSSRGLLKSLSVS